MNRALLFLLLSIFVAPASGDGKKLLDDCRIVMDRIDSGKVPDELDGYFSIGNCLGFVKGVRSTMQILLSDEDDSIFKLCPPSQGATDADAIRAIVKYLEKHPEKLDENETGLAMTALASSFPCQ